MSEIKKIIADCWSELRPVQSRMTNEEAEWFRNFLRAYYFESWSAAAKIAPSKEAFVRVLAETSPQRKTIRWLRKGGLDIQLVVDEIITARPRNRRKVTSHIEDILIEVLDAEQPKSPKIKPNDTRPGVLASARFSVLDLSLIEVHYRLTPW